MSLIKKPFVILFRETFAKWRADNTAGMAAALSYYALFATVPLLIILMALLGSIYGQSTIQFQITKQVSDLFGEDVSSFLLNLVDITREVNHGRAAWLSSIFMIMGSVGVFHQLKWSLDKIWHASSNNLAGWKKISSNLSSFTMVFVIGFMLIMSSIISAFVTVAANRVEDSHLDVGISLLVSDIALFFLMSWLLIGIIFRILPNMRLQNKDIIIGSMFTALLFTFGRLGISLYLGLKNITSIYGATSSVVALLLWAYFSALIFYFGAEFTYVFANRRRYLASDQSSSG